jgi:GH25 family lysozyme M1 (1,4-beta-N-acetylmuramidase)
MGRYVLGIDVWEGNLNIDEPTVKAGGVDFVSVRMNDMNGGHHMDTNFLTQWIEAAPFIRWPYFVYNPWVSGAINYEFMADHMPVGCKVVMPDVEVKYSEITPEEYARQVKAYLALTKRYWKPLLYTGKWFESYLSEWPHDVEYCWARYPYVFRPSGRINMTWEDLYKQVQDYPWQPQANPPGPVRVWQISGDRLLLPGCANRPMDILLWNGTVDELAAWAGQSVPERTPTVEQRLRRLEVMHGL